MATKMKHDLDFTLQIHPDYFHILFQCSIISEIIYEPNPIDILNKNKDYKYFNHGINSMCISHTVDDIKESTIGLEVKYMICDCSTNEKKRLIVGFRGTKSFEDFLVDLKLYAEINNCQGRFHSGIYRRSEMIPIEHFVKKLVEEKYQIIFTGHSLGAAIAALVTVKVILQRALDKEDINNILFIGFGAPLLACQTFKLFIEKHYCNNFHFYVNENDIVPKLLAIFSNVFHEDKEIQEKAGYIDNCKLFLNLLTKPITAETVLLKVFTNVLMMIPEFLKFFGKAVVPKYAPFGRLILLTTKQVFVEYNEYSQVEYQNCIEICLDDAINPKKEKFSIEDTIKGYQNHLINSYFFKLKPYFLENISSLKVKANNPQINEYKYLYIPDDNKNWIKKLSLAELVEPSSYHVRVVINESHSDLFLTVLCKNIEYLVTCLIDYDDVKMSPVKIEKNFESNGVCYIFYCPNERIIRNGELLKDKVSLKFKLFAHFNTASFNVVLNRDEAMKGFTYREEKISTIINDLLYVYGACYVYVLKQLGKELDGELSKKCDQLLNLYAELDKTWDIDGQKNEFLKEENFMESLFKRYFVGESNANERVINDLFAKFFDTKSDNQLNLPATYVKLKDSISKSKNTKELFEKILPTASQLLKLQSETLDVRSTSVAEKLSIGGSLLLIPLFFVPGLNIAAITSATLGASSSLFGVYNIANLYRISMRQRQSYQFILEIFMEALDIKKEKCLPYFYTYEKEIYEEYEKLTLFTLTDDEFLSNWNNIFSKSTFILNLAENSKKTLIKILKTIRINYQIREILKQDFFYGIVGKKKCGKSTFIEQMIPGANANANAIINTAEIKPYKIANTVIMFDFPHFESNDINHKLQFLFSRFLLDYVFFICDAKERADSSDTTNFLQLVRCSFDYRFTVLLNHCDQFWLNKKDNRTTYATEDDMRNLRMEVCNKIEANEEDDRVLLTCLNTDNISESLYDKLSKTEIYTVNKLRKKVFGRIVNQIPKSSDKEAIREIITQKMLEMTLAKQKIISIKKFGKKNSLRLHLIHNIQPCLSQTQEDDDHTDIKSYDDLIEELKEQFELDDPVIRDNENGENGRIYDNFKDFLVNDVRNFVTYEKK